MIRFKYHYVLFAFAVTLLVSGQVFAAKISVTVKNLTHGVYFTPLLISAHSGDEDLFETGEPASEELRAMAEGGNIAGLTGLLGGPDGDTVENPAQGLLGPGESVENVVLQRQHHRNRYLSIVAMLLPTNDGFVGLDALRIPRIPGVYRYYLNGYDAGTEGNDELITGGGAPGAPGIPADPGGNAGSGGSGVIDFDANDTVHIHRGIVGDADPYGGASDLNRAVHRWQNPIAEVIIKVFPRHKYGF